MSTLHTFELDPRHPDQVAALRDFLDPLRTGDVDDDILYAIAVTEIANNAIDAHLANETREPIDVTLDVEKRHVAISDRAGGFVDPPTFGAPEPTDGRGRGLLVARSICPNLRIEHTGVGTRVVLPYTATRR